MWCYRYFNYMNMHCSLLVQDFHTPSLVCSRSPFLLTVSAYLHPLSCLLRLALMVYGLLTLVTYTLSLCHRLEIPHRPSRPAPATQSNRQKALIQRPRTRIQITRDCTSLSPPCTLGLRTRRALRTRQDLAFVRSSDKNGDGFKFA